jgi:hypothetical protein
MSSGEPTSAIEFKGANHQSILKSFSSLPAFDLVTVIEAPENRSEEAPDVRRGVSLMIHLIFRELFKRSVITWRVHKVLLQVLNEFTFHERRCNKNYFLWLNGLQTECWRLFWH